MMPIIIFLASAQRSERTSTTERSSIESFGIVLGAMAIVTLIILSQWVFVRSRNRYSHMAVVAAPLAPNVQVSLWNPAALFSSGTTRVDRVKREERIKLVMDSIIRKKVLSNGDHDSDGLLLPHKRTVTARSSKMSAHSHHSHKLTYRDDDDDDDAVSNSPDEEVGTHLQKDDIYIDSCSMHSTRQHIIVASSHHSSLCSPRSCPICYEKYKKGDEIAWSHNEECLHGFHLKCILEWLVDNDECPMCRSNYIQSVMDEFPIGMPHEVAASEAVQD
jgi:hypothetical protein